jgi:putative ABC transport system permease protein
MLADKRRLLRSTSGIGFAALLMLLQLGFRGAFLDSALGVIHNIDGDILLTSSTKFRFAGKAPFARRQLYAARAVEVVEWARPMYAEWRIAIWKNPQTLKTYNAQVLAFDPDQPIFSFPEVREHLEPAAATRHGPLRSESAPVLWLRGCRHRDRAVPP